MRRLPLALAAVAALVAVPSAHAASSTLAFTEGAASGVFTVPAAGGTPRLLTSGYVPSFSPNGKLLATTNAQGAVQVGNASGTGSRKTVATQSLPHPGPVGWSPNGKQIAYVNNGDIYVVNATGGRAKMVYNETSFVNFATHPVWSNNGKTISFIEAVQGPYATSYTVSSVPATGGRSTTIQGRLAPGWSVTPFSLSASSNGQLAVTLVQNADPAPGSPPGAPGAVLGYAVGVLPTGGGDYELIAGVSGASFAPAGLQLCAQFPGGGIGVVVPGSPVLPAPMLASLSPTACTWVP